MFGGSVADGGFAEKPGTVDGRACAAGSRAARVVSSLGAGFTGKLGTLGGEDAVGGFAAGEGFIEKLGAVVGDARGEKVALPRRGGVGAAAQEIERLRELRRA